MRHDAHEDLRRAFARGSLVASDLINLLLGDLLGIGCFREVFVYDLDPTKVIKIEDGAGSFENVMEWKAWERIKDEPGTLKRWLAPCHFISPNGCVLIQERTYPPPPSYKWPEHVPGFMTDLKRTNFGLIGRRLVCHDYGFNLHSRTRIDARRRRANWWD